MCFLGYLIGRKQGYDWFSQANIKFPDDNANIVCIVSIPAQMLTRSQLLLIHVKNDLEKNVIE